MQAYSYDPKGHYTGQYNCQLDPIATQKNGEAVYLLPASATFLPPPEYSPETEVPVWDGGKYLYVHCAPAGRKLRCIAYCPDVSFCVVGRTRVASSRFTTAYESIVLRCLAEIGLTPEEKKQALDLLLDKYSPNDKEIGRKYAEKSFHRTEIIRLTVKEYSGKCKRIE